MKYLIREAKIIFELNQLKQITLIVEIAPHDIRTINATTSPKAGYTHIRRNERLTEELLQRVAAEGFETH